MEGIMSRFRKVILAALAAFFLFFAWLTWGLRGVPILAYHMVSQDQEHYSIDPEEFDRQMAYLEENGYTAVSLQALFAGFAGKDSLPAKPVVITFDDGYVDNYQTALPILEKHGMRATVFVIAGQVGQAGYMDWQQIQEMQARGTELGSHTFSHAALSEISREEQLQEVTSSKKFLEEKLGRPVVFLAYPNGKFTTETFGVLQEAGYWGACTGVVGLNVPGGNPYALKRVGIFRPRYGMWEFRLRLLRAKLISCF
jgi:peptidoglycan/xylan/chitin deacetylase (PgdA/CDA1 family)